MRSNGSRVIVVLALLLAGALAFHAAEAPPHRVARAAAAAAPGPAGIHTIAPSALPRVLAQDRRVVSVVTADIDADGDVDIVASDGSLDLLVWVNDGDGHFTRQSPRRSTDWQSVPPAPGLGNGLVVADVSTQNDAPTAHVDRTLVVGPLRGASDMSAGRQRAPSIDVGRSSTPRAPPLHS